MTTFYNKLMKNTAQQRAELYNVPLIQMVKEGKITKEIYVDYLTQA